MPETYERTNTYERVVDGQVVERSSPLDGDYEDTRLGLLALEGTDGWRITGAEDAPTDVGATDPGSNETGPDVDPPADPPEPAKPTTATTKGDVKHGANSRRR